MGAWRGGNALAIKRYRDKLAEYGRPLRLGLRIPRVTLTTFTCADCGVRKTIYPRAGRPTPTRCMPCNYKNRAGASNGRWKGGITPPNRKIRASQEYKAWRLAVFERDNYTCVGCGQWGWTLHADHIKPFSKYPELRLEVSNGRTLCVECHKKTDTYLSGAKGRKPRNVGDVRRVLQP